MMLITHIKLQKGTFMNFAQFDYCADDVIRTREMYKRLTFQFSDGVKLKEAA